VLGHPVEASLGAAAFLIALVDTFTKKEDHSTETPTTRSKKIASILGKSEKAEKETK
jgi:hypothetical protein